MRVALGPQPIRKSKEEREMTATTANQGPDAGQVPTRRDFLSIVGASSVAVGAGVIAWPLIDSLNPSADVLALAFTEVDLASIQPGQGIVLLWQGKPVFVRHRTSQEIDVARNVQVAWLRDPQTDADRVKAGHEQWLVVSAVCTHLGCVPGGSKSSEARGEFGGWFCACHGSQYRHGRPHPQGSGTREPSVGALRVRFRRQSPDRLTTARAGQPSCPRRQRDETPFVGTVTPIGCQRGERRADPVLQQASSGNECPAR